MKNITISVSPAALSWTALALLVGAGVGVGVGRATVPADANALVYAGVLEEDGVLVDDPARPINVVVKVGNIERCATGNAPRAVVRGHFRVPLDAECAAVVRDNAGAVVVVEVDGAAVGDPAPITAVPYALEAGALGPGVAEANLGLVVRSGVGRCTGTGVSTDCSCDPGERVIAGFITPAAPLAVRSSLASTTSTWSFVCTNASTDVNCNAAPTLVALTCLGP